MAVSIEKDIVIIGSSPTGYNFIVPTFNPITAILSSTFSSSTSFRYVCDIYINEVYSTRLKVYPDAGGYGVFEIQRIVENYISEDKLSTGSTFYSSPNSIKKVQCKYGEEYSLPGESIITYLNQSIGGFIWATNSALQYMDYMTYDYYDYLPTGDSSMFITNQPKTLYIRSDEPAFISFYQMDNTYPGQILLAQALFVRIDTFDSNGATVGSYTMDNTIAPVYGDISPIGFKVSLGIGPLNLSSATYTTLYGPSASIIGATVDHYTYRLSSDGTIANSLSETRRYNINDDCSRLEEVRISFLNRMGAFDQITLRKIAEDTSISSNNFDKYIGYRNGSAAWDYSIGDRGRTSLSVNTSTSLSFVTKFLTEEESIWLEELFTSPSIYIIKDGKSIPVVMSSTLYPKILKTDSKMISYSISMNYAFNKNIQRG